MERRYLAATIGLVVAFAIATSGFQPENIQRALCSRDRLVSEFRCVTRTVGTALAANLPSVLRHQSPQDEALMAQMQVEDQLLQAKLDAAQAKLEAKLDAKLQAKLDAKRAKFDALQAKFDKLQHEADFTIAPLPPTPAMALPAVPAAPQAVNIAISQRSCARAAKATEAARRALERSARQMQRDQMAMAYRMDLPQTMVRVEVPDPVHQTAYSFTVPDGNAMARHIRIQVMHDLETNGIKVPAGDML